MQIDLPDDLVARAKSIATAGQDAAAVFGEALSALEFERAEVGAVEEGIAAYEAGDFEPLEDFDQAFRERHHIPRDA